MATSEIRPPAVAGVFYPAHRVALAAELRALLDEAGAPASGATPKALIVPHAGYVYSGPVAACAYRRLAGGRGRIRRVVLLGPAHRVAVDGLALPAARAFATPLGRVPVDRDLVAAVSAMPDVTVSAAAHALEHALEVQLPFLQQVLGDFTLLPLLVGRADAAQVAAVLERVWGGAETLILVSSDLSHYLSYDAASDVDRRTVGMILRGEARLDHEQACGGTPVNGLLRAAARAGLSPELLDLRNSGDTAGDRGRVVGYCAIAFHPPAARPRERGAALTGLARGAIAGHLARTALPPVTGGWLEAPAATFVTLRRGGSLRGCIGSLEAVRPLGRDVRENALAAAFRDPRFPPLGGEELPDTRIEVSLLSQPVPLPCRDEEEALARLRPGVDGVTLALAGRRATFLPQVWEDLPEPAAFLAALKRKAGLAPAFWSADLRLARYTVTKYAEPSFP